MMTDEQVIQELSSSSYVEILLRGRTVQVSSRIEHYLISIMLMCKATQPDIPSNKVKFAKTPYDDKINKAQKYLKEFAADIYSEKQSVFTNLFQQKEFINQLAHCNIRWNPNDRSYFTVFDKFGKGEAMYPAVNLFTSYTECKYLKDGERFSLNRIKDYLGIHIAALALFSAIIATCNTVIVWRGKEKIEIVKAKTDTIQAQIKRAGLK